MNLKKFKKIHHVNINRSKQYAHFTFLCYMYTLLVPLIISCALNIKHIFCAYLQQKKKLKPNSAMFIKKYTILKM